MAMPALSPAQQEALTRMGETGVRGAAQALSQLLGEVPALTISSVELVPLRDAAALVGPGDRLVAGITFHLFGAATGRVAVLFPRGAALALVAALTGGAPGRHPAFTEEDQAVLKEVGNILVSAYVSAAANLLKVVILPSIPHLIFDLAEAVVGAMAGGGNGDGPSLATRFADPSRGIEGVVLWSPGRGGRDPLLDLLLARG